MHPQWMTWTAHTTAFTSHVDFFNAIIQALYSLAQNRAELERWRYTNDANFLFVTTRSRILFGLCGDAITTCLTDARMQPLDAEMQHLIAVEDARMREHELAFGMGRQPRLGKVNLPDNHKVFFANGTPSLDSDTAVDACYSVPEKYRWYAWYSVVH